MPLRRGPVRWVYALLSALRLSAFEESCCCRGYLPVAAGTISGIMGAMLTGRFLESLVEGAKSTDLATFHVLGSVHHTDSVDKYMDRYPPHCWTQHHGDAAH